MRKALLVGAGLSIMAMSGMANAQTPPAPGAQPPAAENATPTPPPSPPAEGRGPMDGHFGGPGRMMGMMRMMQYHQAARFRFHRGDAGIEIRCAANESTQACVTAAGTLMDKLGSMRGSGQ